MGDVNKSAPAAVRATKRTIGILGISIAMATASQLVSAACEYEVTNAWGSGFTAAIRITNTTANTINGWDVSWQYSGGSRVTNLWNATLSGSNPYTATDIGWNGSIQPGQSVEFGFQGTVGGTADEVPAVTGDACESIVATSSSVAESSRSSVAESSSVTFSSWSSTDQDWVISSSSQDISSSSSSQALSSSQASSVDNCIEMCKWYQDSLRPLCVNQTSGWGWENAQTCIGRSTCEGQDPSSPGGIVSRCGDNSSAAVSSASVAESSSSSVVVSSSSIVSSSSSSIDGTEDNLYTLVDFPVGVAVSAGNETRAILNTPEKQKTIAQHFSQLTAGNIMKMSYLHPQENTYSWTNADALVDWAKSKGISVHGHALIWHSDYQVPNFMKNYNGDFEAMLDEHVTTIADHYKGDVVSWDVVNEAIDENQSNCYRNSVFYQKLGAAFIENAFRAADAADPNADLYYNDYDTEGGNSNKLNCLLDLIDDLQDNGVPIDGVGFQMHVQIDWPSTSNLRTAFQAIVDRGLKVKITELDVPVNNPYASTVFPQYDSFSADAQQKQKARYKAIAKTYMDVVPPALRGGFTVWGLWDGDSWLLSFDERQGSNDWPLLFGGPATGPYETKPAFDGVVEAFKGL